MADQILEVLETARLINSQQTDILALQSKNESLRNELRIANELNAKVNDAVNRAGIHCAVYWWEAIDMIAAERDRYKQALERIRDAAHGELRMLARNVLMGD